jgi:type IV secretory pathway VirB10-like protein
MKLPPLGGTPVRTSTVKRDETSVAGSLVDPDSAAGRALLTGAAAPGATMPMASAYGGPPPIDPVLQRQISAPVLVRGASVSVPRPDEQNGETPSGEDAPEPPIRAAAAVAGLLPDRRYLLPKGAFVDCTLETAIDSTLPGLATCITATDVWSADGSVVLMERGTKLVGETRGGVRQGQRRVFVLWNEARTPTGVTVDLASGGTDALGRAGLTGEVDTHFAARFGAAILISVIDAGAAALVAAQSEGSSNVVIAPQGASDVAAEVLRETVDIPPTIRVAQGQRMQVLVARDVSFERVYRLARR